MSITTEQAAVWFAYRAKNTPMPGARAMFEIAATALREKAEREDPKPLTLEELRQMDGEPVWLKVIDKNDSRNPHRSEWSEVFLWVQNISFWRFGNECEIEPNPDNYGKTWLAYRHKPKEVE